MSYFLTAVSIILLVLLASGLWRILRGSAADCMLVAQLFGTVGVAIVLLFAVLFEQYALLDVALIMALLAPLALIGFIKLTGSRQGE